MSPESLDVSEEDGSNFDEIVRFFFSILGVKPLEFVNHHWDLLDFLVASRWSLEKRHQDVEEKKRWLFRKWMNYFKEEVDLNLGTVILRMSILENMSWEEISSFTSLSVARVRSLALEALAMENDFADLENRVQRDCARNDLFILDMLAETSWDDPLKLNSVERLVAHQNECERCGKWVSEALHWKSNLHRVSSFEVKHPNVKKVFEATPLVRPAWQIVVRGLASLSLVALVLFGVSRLSDWRLTEGVANLSSSFAQILQEYREELPEPIEVIEPEVSGELEDQVSLSEPDSPETQPLEAVSIEEDQQELSLPEQGFTPPKEPLVLALNLPQSSGRNSEDSPEKLKDGSASIQAKQSSPSTNKKTKAPAKNLVKSPIFYRLGARAEDPDRVATKVLELLKSKGAENVSELELGASYRNGRYFHFAIEQVDYEPFTKELRLFPLSDYSQTQSKEKRNTPPGKVRVVLWIGPSL